MKIIRDETGHLLFTPQEWRTAQQISSFFSRLSAAQRQREMEKDPCKDANEDFPEDDPDLDALENEIAFENLRKAVTLQMNTPEHPIVVENKNLCELLKAKKLNTLKVAELREICEGLQLEVSGSLSRKKSFIEPLEAYAKSCSCFKCQNEC